MAKAYKVPSAPCLRTVSFLITEPQTGELIWPVTRSNRNPAGGVAGGKSCRIRLDGGLFEVHRIVWMWVKGEEPEDQIDHKDLEPFQQQILEPMSNQHAEHLECQRAITMHQRAGWALKLRAGQQISPPWNISGDTEAEAREDGLRRGKQAAAR